MSDAVFAHGTKLKLETTAGGGSYTEIPLAGDMGYTEPVPQKLEIPDQSDSSGFKKFIYGLKDGGKVDVPISFNPAVTIHMTLWNAHGTIRNFQMVFPGTGSETRQFAAGIALDHNLPNDKQWTASVKLEISGAVTKV